MTDYNLMSVILDQRSVEAAQFQNILTKNGCMIKMRLGLHEVDSTCSEEGLIVLLLKGNESEIETLARDLKSIRGVKVNHMKIQ